jgi:ketosteroid isomerase-like protein
MRTAIFALIIGLSISAAGQSDLEKVVAAERAFAAAANERGVKAAFLDYMANGAVLFMPDRVIGRDWWQTQEEWDSVLAWYPEIAGVSSNGVIGFTTGPWELRSKGGGTPEAAGQFASIWQRQPDGEYRMVLDIGIAHSPISAPQKAWSGTGAPAAKLADHEAGDAAVPFFEMAARGTLTAAYKRFAAPDIRILREGRPPVSGAKNIGDALKDTKGRMEINKRLAFIGTRDLAYVEGRYRRTDGSTILETGNFLQVWQFDGKHWRIVLDVFKPIPATAN